MSDGSELIFNEVQQFRQPLLWILFCVICVITIFVIYFVLKKLTNARKKSKVVVISSVTPIVIIILIAVLLFIAKLEVQVRPGGISVRFFPLHFSFEEIPFEKIKEYRQVTFSPISDYGGWGIRYGSKGKAYIVSGEKGVLLKFKDGSDDLCIGSQQPEQLFAVLDGLKKSGSK